MEKMNILIADSFEIPGGEEEVAFYIYENLDRNKCRVYITGNEKSGYFVKKRPVEEERINIFVKGKYNIPEMIRLRTIIKKKKIDVVNVHGYSAGFFVRVACAGLRKTKVIWATHGNVDLMFEEGSFKQKINTFIEDILNRHRIFTDEIITVCEDGAKRLRKRKVEKIPITNIYNCIDTDKYIRAKKIYNKNATTMTIGFFSRLSFQKDIPLLLHTTKKLVDEGLKIELIIAGDGDEKEKMVGYIKDNALESHIEYLGFVSNILSLYEKVDIVVLPTHFECLPMVLLEAMCTGTPVIASDVGGVGEIVKNDFNGYVVPAGDEDAFRRKIIHYYNNRSLIKMHGENAKSFVSSNFDISKMVNEYYKVFERNWVRRK